MAKRAKAEAAELLGLPVLPPGRAVGYANRARRRLRRASETAPPFVVVLERLLGIYDVVVLRLLCRNDIAEAVVAGGGTAAEVAARLGPMDPPVDVDALHRVLRYAAVRGFVKVDRRGRFRPNHVTAALTATHPTSAEPWVEFLASASTWRILEQADEALFGRSPSRAAHGTDFFTHVHEQSPADGARFNGAMAAASHVQALLVIDAFDFASVDRVVDIGGGTGEMGRVLVAHHPNLDVTVFDLPPVVEAGQARPGADRLTWVDGDFFIEVPAGADVYTLLAILHDWSDDDAVRILSTVRTAMGTTGRCLVVDATLAERHPDGLVAATDVMMLMLTDGGRERTRREWHHLVADAQLRVVSHRLLATGFSLYELAAA